MLNIFKNFLREEEGQDLVEYALLLALITLACVVALGAMSDSLNSLWNAVAGQLNQNAGGGS